MSEKLPMLPTKADDELMATYVSRIVTAVRDASPAQVERGLYWYPTAHDLAAYIADGNVKLGAGLLAAFSASKSWTQNKKLAEDAANGNVHGHVEDALNKARRILEGEDPLLVLPSDSKTWNFYRTILDPSDPDPVVVDRHVHDAIAGRPYGNQDRNLSNKTRYATLAHAVRVASRELDMIPAVAQPILWIVHTDLTRGTGTRPKDQGYV